MFSILNTFVNLQRIAADDFEPKLVFAYEKDKRSDAALTLQLEKGKYKIEEDDLKKIVVSTNHTKKKGEKKEDNEKATCDVVNNVAFNTPTVSKDGKDSSHEFIELEFKLKDDDNLKELEKALKKGDDNLVIFCCSKLTRAKDEKKAPEAVGSASYKIRGDKLSKVDKVDKLITKVKELKTTSDEKKSFWARFKWWILGGIFLAALIIVGLVYMLSKNGDDVE